MSTTGSGHTITLTPAKNRWRAHFAGHVIADSGDALILEETGFPPRVYFPREDVAMEYMSRTDASTRCPHKGDASYYTILMDGHFAENAVWTYENPLSDVAAIAGRLSFYPDQVDVYEVDDAAVNPRHHEHHTDSGEVDEIVKHTDSGAGAAQREHWAPNVGTPNQEGGVR
jgi:uncharacterized protein (DUF427 family)